jgi:uncharacterized membrane protein
VITFAIILVFISAILHVTWNVLIQSENDPLAIATKAITFGILVLTPFMIIYWLSVGAPMISRNAILFGFLSGVAELFYFIFLSYSYKKGELSVVYPIARGTAPILTFTLGIFLLQETVSPFQIIGVLFLLVGIWLVRRAKVSSAKGIIPALFTGVFIAAYTVIDKIGLQYTTPIFFGELKYFFTALCLVAFIPIRGLFINKSKSDSIGIKTSWKKIALIGVCLIATYQLILFALSIAPVSIISPLRESASVLITAWGIWKLKEREGLRYKIVGVLLIFSGIILLTF